MNNILLIAMIFFLIVANIFCNNNVKDTKAKISDSITSITDSIVPTKKPEQSCNYFFESDSISICLSFIKGNRKHIKFNLDFVSNNKSQKISDQASLLLIEDDSGKPYVPEGTYILDESTNEQYLCDSTYAFYSENINISFGFEKKSAKRLSLVIYKSKITSIENKEYTLYKRK